tara:strand:+ start:121 stop:366 length:246 start_codon:yes stop_codon:yes gene_type:complete
MTHEEVVKWIRKAEGTIKALVYMVGGYTFLLMIIISLLVYIHKEGMERQEQTNKDQKELNSKLVDAVTGINRLLDRNQITE